MRREPSERFWQKVDKGQDCWLWLAHCMRNGRPMFHYNGRPVLAYRMAWTLTNGAIPDGLLVCHHCDNARCVNPAHLFLGTNQDNMTDMVKKGRYTPRNLPKGSAANNAKLTESQVLEIRHRLKSGRCGALLAREFGVCQSVISAIKHGHNWRHLQ